MNSANENADVSMVIAALEIDRLRAELAERPTEHECEGIREALRNASDRANTAEAAIGRVREIHVRWRMGCWDDHSRIFQDQVLRALGGGTE